MLQNLIPSRLKSLITKRPKGSGGAWRKRALILSGFILAFLIIAHLGVRYVIWPQIEKSKASVEKLIGARIGAEVSMEKLEVSWIGIRPSFEIDGLRFNGQDKTKPLLQIQKISGELSWASFYHLIPYFHDLHIQGAEIYAQRNKKGIISVAGIPIHGNSNDHSAEDWLFSQNEIDIHDVKLVWDDQLNKKAIASLDIQNLSLSNGIRRHIALLRTSTPWSTGPIELEANFVHHLGGQPGNWRDWIGTITWDLKDLNLNQIAKDFTLPLNTLEGKLSSKGKLKIDNGRPDGGETYIAGDNLIIQLAKNEDAIALGRLETNFIQETVNGLNSITTKTFAWRDIDAPKNAALEILSPMTFRWKPPGADGEIKEFGFSSPKILVEDVALFAVNLPLSKKIQQWIKASHADGELQNLDINWSESKSPLSALNIPGGWFKSNKVDFTVSAKLNNLSFVGINKSMPSVTNLSGFISGNQNEGSFSINSTDVVFDVNDLLVDPKIKLDRANGKITWGKQKGNWVISANQLELSNPEITTSLNLNYILGGAKKPDYMTLDMDFAKANLATAYRYLPVGMDKDTKTYLSKAFLGGTVQKGKLHAKGDPNGIPFPKGTDGEFTLNLPIEGAAFSPTPLIPSNQGVWSTLTNMTGLLAMQNSSFVVDVSKANYKQVSLNQFHAEIPNVSAKQLVLMVNGNVQGDAPQILEYIFASPFAKKQEKVEKNLQVTGPINLNIGLKVPLSGPNDANVDIKVDLAGNRAQWSDLPPLENLKGKVRITEIHPEFEDVSANFLGGALKITSMPSTAGNQSFSIAGNISANFLKDYFAKTLKSESVSILQAMSGTSKYEGTLNFNKTGSETNLTFDLRDWASLAPAPAKKQMGTPLNGQITFKTQSNNKSPANRLSWSGKLGDLFEVQGNLGNDDELRYALGVGAPAIIPPQGFSLNLSSAELNLDAWQDFIEGQNKKAIAAKVDNSSADDIQITAQVKRLTFLDRIWPDMNIAANNKNASWQMRLTSPLIAGQVQYQEPTSTHTSGIVSGHLSHLKASDELSSPATVAKPSGSDAKKPETHTIVNKANLVPSAIPSLNLVIDDFIWSKARLGQVKIKTITNKNTLKIESIQANNPQGNSVISGQWNGGTKNEVEHSNIKADLDVKDAGQIIAHWTSQKTVEGGQGKISANAEWDGSPFSPKYETLSGTVNLDLEKGRLLEVNTSGAKLLDVLSLQSLFKFATLDIQGGLGNIVTKGTPFSDINGSFDINNGVAQTRQFSMNLDQARVAMSGQINIPKQTQDLRVTIFPTIDATAGSLAAFAINPIVGLGALIGQYLISHQINRNLQSDYLVQGSWENPEVIPLDQKGQPIDEKTIDSIRSKELLKEQSRPEPRNAPNSSINTAPLNNSTAPR